MWIAIIITLILIIIGMGRALWRAAIQVTELKSDLAFNRRMVELKDALISTHQTRFNTYLKIFSNHKIAIDPESRAKEVQKFDEKAQLKLKQWLKKKEKEIAANNKQIHKKIKATKKVV